MSFRVHARFKLWIAILRVCYEIGASTLHIALGLPLWRFACLRFNFDVFASCWTSCIALGAGRPGATFGFQALGLDFRGSRSSGGSSTCGRWVFLQSAEKWARRRAKNPRHLSPDNAVAAVALLATSWCRRSWRRLNVHGVGVRLVVRLLQASWVPECTRSSSEFRRLWRSPLTEVLAVSQLTRSSSLSDCGIVSEISIG